MAGVPFVIVSFFLFIANVHIRVACMNMYILRTHTRQWQEAFEDTKNKLEDTRADLSHTQGVLSETEASLRQTKVELHQTHEQLEDTTQVLEMFVDVGTMS